MKDDDEIPTPIPRRRYPNGGSDRIDELNDAVKLLTSMVHRCIAASEAARDYSDRAVEASRDNAGAIGKLARETAQLRNDVREVKFKLGEIEKTVGRWPQGPDDTGSGVAGRVAMISSHQIEPVAMSTPPPKALVLLWKKYRKVGATVAILVAIISAMIQILATTGGSQ